MSQIQRAAYLRERAANFRRLAQNHGAAGNVQISAKMTEVAEEFEAHAAQLLLAGALSVLQQRIETVGSGVADLEALAAAERSRASSMFNRDDQSSR